MYILCKVSTIIWIPKHIHCFAFSIGINTCMSILFHLPGSEMVRTKCIAIFATQNQFCIAIVVHVICIAIPQCKRPRGF